MTTLDGEGNLRVNVGFCLARCTAAILLCQKSATLDFSFRKARGRGVCYTKPTDMRASCFVFRDQHFARCSAASRRECRLP